MNPNTSAKILIVEDDLSLRKAVVTRLNTEGYITYEAKDGEEGIKLALEIKPELVLLDILMPKVNGIQVLKEIRENEWGKSAKIVVFTNLPLSLEIQASMMQYEPNYYFIKSETSLEEMVQKVEELIKK